MPALPAAPRQGSVVTAPVVTDRTACRDCGGRVHTVWCADGLWRFFDPAPAAGPGWWWSKARAGMVNPAAGPGPLHGYQVHRCPEENLPLGQLELFPVEAATQRPRRARTARRHAGGVA